MKGKAFTLVELLVVIGIIAILIGILLPVMNRAKETANTIKCAAHLREVGKMWQTYAAENKGISVPGRLPKYGTGADYGVGNGQQYRPHWYEVLGASMKQYADRSPQPAQSDAWKVDSDLFVCPTVEWRNSRNLGYGYNYQFLGNTHVNTSGGFVNYPVKVNAITRSGQTVMASDSMGTAAGKPAALRKAHYEDGTHDPYALGDKGHLIDPPRLTANSDYADPMFRMPDHRSAPDPRHRGKANFLFCDGHVELLTLLDAGYVLRANGAVDVVAPAHNRMFSGDGEDRDPPPVN